MKLTLASLLLLLTAYTHGCDRIYSFQVGPFFSTSSVLRYWDDFASAVTKASKCRLKIVTTSSYEDYLSSIIEMRHDVYLSPSHYGQAFINQGYTPILTTTEHAKLFLVTRLDVSDNNFDKLAGTTISVPSPYTRAFLTLEEWLQKHDLIDKVTYDFNHSHDSAALVMLKGGRSSTVMLSVIYDALPEVIRKTYTAIELSSQAGGLLHVRPSLPSQLVEAIKQSPQHLGFQKWAIAKPPFNDPYQSKLIEQFEDFKRKTAN